MAKWKQKVLFAKRPQQDYSERLAYYTGKYDKLNVWQPNPNPNMENYRYLPNDFVFKNISLTAKGIYPVLCCKADFRKHKQFQVSQENIGRMAGVKHPATIRKAVTELVDAGIVTAEFIQKERQYWIYDVDFVLIDEGTDIEKWNRRGTFYRFNTAIIESGVWAKLTPRQQVFYQALRSVSKICSEELDFYFSEFGYDVTVADFYKSYTAEGFVGSVSKLCKDAGVSFAHINTKVIPALTEAGLIKVHTTTTRGADISVFLFPKALEGTH